jgi:uncharacterized membrane protein
MNYKKNLLSCFIIFISLMSCCNLSACPICYTKSGIALRTGLLQHNFLLILAVIIGVFLIFIMTVTTISYLLANKISHKSIKGYNYWTRTISYFLVAGMLLGGGVAGFIDGIAFHQILQFHNMIASKLPINSLVNAEINMFWDGVFHAFTLLITLISILLFWIAINDPGNYKSGLLLVGSIFIGAGLFNLIEGLIDHHLFQLHHVIQLNTSNAIFYADLIFLCAAVIAIAAGIFCLRKSIKQA